MLTTTTVALRAAPLLSGALATGVTNDSRLLAGDSTPLRPTTVTSYLRSRSRRRCLCVQGGCGVPKGRPDKRLHSCALLQPPACPFCPQLPPLKQAALPCSSAHSLCAGRQACKPPIHWVGHCDGGVSTATGGLGRKDVLQGKASRAAVGYGWCTQRAVHGSDAEPQGAPHPQSRSQTAAPQSSPASPA